MFSTSIRFMESRIFCTELRIRFMGSVMRWISAISALFFGYAAAMQIEGDPDTIYWVSIYASIGLYSLCNLVLQLGKDYILIPLIIGGVALAWGLWLLPEFNLIVDGEVLNIFVKVEQGEEEREVFGLLLVFLFAVFEMFHSFRNAGNGSNEE